MEIEIVEKTWKFVVGYIIEGAIIAGLIENLFKISWKWGIFFWIILIIIDIKIKTHYITKSINWVLEKLEFY